MVEHSSVSVEGGPNTRPNGYGIFLRSVCKGESETD